MTQKEYEEIFGAELKQTFNTWDLEHSGLIDILNVFCGVIIFSTGKDDDKIRFIFEIFDFNDETFISIECLELLLYKCL